MTKQWVMADVTWSGSLEDTVEMDVSGLRWVNLHTEGPSQPSDPKVDDTWTDTNSGETFRWNGTGWVQEGFDPEHPVPDSSDAE